MQRRAQGAGSVGNAALFDAAGDASDAAARRSAHGADGAHRQQTAAGSCRWYEAGPQRICWSQSLRLPLVVERDGAASRIVTVDSVQVGRIAPAVFTADASVTRVDVDRDLD